MALDYILPPSSEAATQIPHLPLSHRPGRPGAAQGPLRHLTSPKTPPSEVYQGGEGICLLAPLLAMSPLIPEKQRRTGQPPCWGRRCPSGWHQGYRKVQLPPCTTDQRASVLSVQDCLTQLVKMRVPGLDFGDSASDSWHRKKLLASHLVVQAQLWPRPPSGSLSPVTTAYFSPCCLGCVGVSCAYENCRDLWTGLG